MNQQPPQSTFSFTKLIAVIVVAVAAVVCVAILKKGSVSEAITGSAASSQSSFRTYADLIVGSWEAQLDMPNGSMKIRDTYSPGGHFNQAGVITMDGQDRVLAVSGTWEVNGDRVKTTVESSNIPELVPNGFSQTDKILRIDLKEMEIEQATAGVRYICKRVN